ncbi:GMC family oxidoreductase [Cyclobacteriaceae bacterium]|jgi:choline dehydrogenase-like flavoprotein|nr:GMC family oxidoreductase [Cyclobacteriaceae bacterium]MDB9883504.1 GMC family oxidoreductase [Cyclobacteriaceae bacterium]MDB9939364.1 GMC family oxidoreductase [Cyclobacteriaceae bacterium]MDC1369063.1 GMC family oxidoreductase [Cyclobacteriaceae bacterium]MDC6483927.1 GMC family oxidoreductase [Cyclobacteriaceae bacterium]|tara:strand:- start:3118 stop:4818 length:1701 start_codon:yes stop_codon:yes gene_type:complete
MANFNIDAKKEKVYDAIVIGSGISGGWAAKELCEKGLKTLVLERGRIVEHVVDYPTMNLDPWDMELRGGLTPEEKEKHYKNIRSGWVGKDTEHFWADDAANPYTETKPFLWLRGHQMGGRSLLWGKQTYRWSDLDFEANAKDGNGVDWPIRYKDIKPWYTYVEKFAGISGEAMNLPQLPDSHFLPPMEMNCVEKHIKGRIEKEFSDRNMIIGRCAHLTQPHNGRGQCQNRNRCSRGCPYGAYFSSNAVTLPPANASGNLTIRPYSIVQSLIYDEAKEKVTGVRIIDSETNEAIEYSSKIIFVNASTLSTTQILLNSKSSRFENGLGNDSGELGHNLMDHTYRVGAMGKVAGFDDKYYKGRRPNGIYIPRYVNIDENSKSDKFVRGFGFQGEGFRGGNPANIESFGADYKDSILKPGPWEFFITGFAECLPYHDNQVTLNGDVLDKWGQPTLSIDAEFKANEKALNKQIQEDAVEMLQKVGLKDILGFDKEHPPGYGVHEMGTARMGRDPKTSVLNDFNQVHAAKNVFVTDGACMTSSSCVNPSLTYMALTARAANHAVSELKKLNF